MVIVIYELQIQRSEGSVAMQLTVFGATGGTGTQLVNQALASGHDVTAVVRDAARLASPPQPRLRVVTADIMDSASILPAVAGADAVLTAAGPRGTGATTVITDSVRSIAAAMHETGVRRLLALSGSIAADEGESFYLRYLLKPVARRTFLRHVCADMRNAEAVIEATDLDWTIVRPPALTDGPATGRYRTAVGANLPHAFRVSRADLAGYLLALIGDPAALRQPVSIAY
jgi:putative NADH-flavin reductase